MYTTLWTPPSIVGIAPMTVVLESEQIGHGATPGIAPDIAPACRPLFAVRPEPMCAFALDASSSCGVP